MEREMKGGAEGAMGDEKETGEQQAETARFDPECMVCEDEEERGRQERGWEGAGNMMREVQAERDRVRRRRESTEDRTRVRVNYTRATFESTVCVLGMSLQVRERIFR